MSILTPKSKMDEHNVGHNDFHDDQHEVEDPKYGKETKGPKETSKDLETRNTKECGNEGMALSTKELASIESLAKLLGQYDLEVLELERQGVHLRLEKSRMKGFATTSSAAVSPAGNAVVTNSVPQSFVEPDSLEDSLAEESQPKETIKSPMVGVFYGQPSPEAPAFVQVGDRVAKGQVLCIIETMKIMNEIKAPRDLTILKVLKADDELVSFEEDMFEVSYE